MSRLDELRTEKTELLTRFEKVDSEIQRLVFQENLKESVRLCKDFELRFSDCRIIVNNAHELEKLKVVIINILRSRNE